MEVEKNNNNAMVNSGLQPKYNKEGVKSQLPQRIKILQTIQKKFAIVGIYLDVVSQPYLYNGRIMMGYFIMGSATVSNFVYIFYEAKSFGEYTRSSFFCAACIYVSIVLTILTQKVKKIVEIINEIENLANTSKYILRP